MQPTKQPNPTKPPSFLKKFDLQDVTLILGVVALCTGIGFVYWPAGLIVFGLLCLFTVLLIERATAVSKLTEPKSAHNSPQQ